MLSVSLIFESHDGVRDIVMTYERLYCSERLESGYSEWLADTKRIGGSRALNPEFDYLLGIRNPNRSTKQYNARDEVGMESFPMVLDEIFLIRCIFGIWGTLFIIIHIIVIVF